MCVCRYVHGVCVCRYAHGVCVYSQILFILHVISVVIVCSLLSWCRPAIHPNQHVPGSTGCPLLTWLAVKGLQRLRRLVQGPKKQVILMSH